LNQLIPILEPWIWAPSRAIIAEVEQQGTAGSFHLATMVIHIQWINHKS
jgi:hypothetical protein